ncbi:MAG: LysR family transcriptional regulator [Candidatus Saccharibacteria bacterium]|nr:LysR family transcriptional regulator [Rhodoferax sp.]
MNALIELRRLQHFLLLADKLNFSRAAEQAHLSQTAFSRSIQALEEEAGLRLFDRGTRSVKITAAGRHLVARAQGLLAQANDLSRDLHFMANGDVGELKLGAGLMAVHGLLREVLPRFKQQRPGLRVHVEVGDWEYLAQSLLAEKIEFFVAYSGRTMQDTRFTVQPLRAQPASIYCRKGHPLLATRRAPMPRQIADYPWAAVHIEEEIGKSLRPLFGMAPDSPLPLGMNCNSLDLLLDTTLESDMLLITWASWLQDALKRGRLVDIGARLKPAPPRHAFQLDCAIVRLAHRTPSPAAQGLMQRLAEAGQ